MKTDLISIIMPVYNAELFLQQLLESCIKQTYQNIEIICVDDGSTDRSSEIIQAYIAKDPRIVYIYKHNSGVSATRNIGIQNSKGKYIFFIDSDDLLVNDAIESLYNQSKKTLSDITVGNYINRYPNYEKVNKVVIESGDIDVNDSKQMIQFVFDSGLGTAIWNKLYKREIIGDTRFAEGVHFSEDFLFNYEIFTKKPTIVFFNHNTYIYRIHTDTLSYKKKPNLGNKYIIILNRMFALDSVAVDSLKDLKSFYMYLTLINVSSNSNRNKNKKDIKHFIKNINKEKEMFKNLKNLKKYVRKKNSEVSFSHKRLIGIILFLLKMRWMNCLSVILYKVGKHVNKRNEHFKLGDVNE